MPKNRKKMRMMIFLARVRVRRVLVVRVRMGLEVSSSSQSGVVNDEVITVDGHTGATGPSTATVRHRLAAQTRRSKGK